MSRTETGLRLAALLTVLTACTPATPPLTPAAPAPRIVEAAVLAAVQRAAAIRTLPADLTPALADTAADLGFDNEQCEAGPAADRIEPCVFGDRASAIKVILYGDSHAGMWLPPMIQIADRLHWRLMFFGKPGCPAVRLTVWNQRAGRRFEECDRFRDSVTERIKAERPDLVVLTNGSFEPKSDRGVLVTPVQWQTAVREMVGSLRLLSSRVVVLGDIPVLAESGPECLAAHPADVAACGTSRNAATERVWHAAEQDAARESGAGYVSVLPWLCSAVCTPVIGNVTVYRNRFHLTATYAR
ncbi:MAG: SGNH hydrolase domain-containing protein, partial [Actinoplanes sp.]